MKTWYNGYQYSRSASAAKVYNPISVFSFLETGHLDNYWFATATPTFAINMVKERAFPILDFRQGIIAGKEIEAASDMSAIDTPTLLFQTGYLTIRHYDENMQTYCLQFPNEEVRRS